MKTLLILLLAVLTLGGCATQIKTYQKPNLDKRAYTTWCWLQGCEVTYQGPPEYFNQQALDQIATSITNQLKFKGYVQHDEEPDLVVNFYLVVEPQQQQVQEPIIQEPFLNDQWLITRHPEYVQYLKGSLVIDIIDRKNSVLIWRSNIISYMDMQPHVDITEIDRVIDKAMRRFPQRAR